VTLRSKSNDFIARFSSTAPTSPTTRPMPVFHRTIPKLAVRRRRLSRFRRRGSSSRVSSRTAADINPGARRAFQREHATRPHCRGRAFYHEKGPALRLLHGLPEKEIVIAPLAVGRGNFAGKIVKVELLGFTGKVDWTHDANGLTAQLPGQKPCEHAYVLKVTGLATA
jgi:hypothetical protein